MLKAKVIFLIFTSLLSCDPRYGKGVQKDAQKQFRSHKEFLRKIFFQGVIKEKIYCQECDTNKYRLTILVQTKNPASISLGDRSYQPYYNFGKESELTISVNKRFYESVREGSSVKKESDSDTITVDDVKYGLLSPKEFVWIPD